MGLVPGQVMPAYLATKKMGKSITHDQTYDQQVINHVDDSRENNHSGY